MKRDFDYVTMQDYVKDTAELTSQATGIIAKLQQDIKDRERVIRSVIRSNGGKLSVSLRSMADESGSIISEEDFASDCRIYKLRDHG